MSTLPHSGGLACQRMINESSPSFVARQIVRVDHTPHLRHVSISGLLRVIQARCQPSPPLTYMYSSPRGKIVRGRLFTGFGCTLSIPRSSLPHLVRPARLEHRTQESASIH